MLTARQLKIIKLIMNNPGIHGKEISENLKEQYKIEIDKKKIEVKETIKNIGRFTINIKLYEGVNAKLTVNIIAE